MTFWAAAGRLSTDVQFAPPSVELKTPLPLTPAYRTRALVGVVVSSSRLSTAAESPAPSVQFRPRSVDTWTPSSAATYSRSLSAGSTMTSVIETLAKFVALPVFPSGKPEPSSTQLAPPSSER